MWRNANSENEPSTEIAHVECTSVCWKAEYLFPGQPFENVLRSDPQTYGESESCEGRHGVTLSQEARAERQQKARLMYIRSDLGG